MSIIGLKELRENTQKIINRVNRGESFIVVRRSKPVFKLSPAKDEDIFGDEGHWETIIDFTKIKRGGVSIDEILKRL